MEASRAQIMVAHQKVTHGKPEFKAPFRDEITVMTIGTKKVSRLLKMSGRIGTNKSR